MNHVPDICVSLCGALLLLSVPILMGFYRAVANAPERNDWD